MSHKFAKNITTDDPDIEGRIFATNIVTSSASTLNLQVGVSDYIFTGTSATYTSTPLTVNNRFKIINIGTGNITLNSNAGGNTLVDVTNATTGSSLIIPPDSGCTVIDDGTKQYVIMD